MIIYILTVLAAIGTKWYWERYGSDDNMYVQMKRDMKMAVCSEDSYYTGDFAPLLLLYILLIFAPIANLMGPIASIVIIIFYKLRSIITVSETVKKGFLKIMFQEDCKQ